MSGLPSDLTNSTLRHEQQKLYIWQHFAFRVISFFFVVAMSVALFVLFFVLAITDPDYRFAYIGYLVSIVTLHIPAPITGVKSPKKTVTTTTPLNATPIKDGPINAVGLHSYNAPLGDGLTEDGSVAGDDRSLNA